MKLVMIANPVAGGGARPKVQAAIELLKKAGYEVDVRWTQHGGHAIELARQAAGERPDLVTSVGGDGTLNEVICGLAGSDVPLGVIPLGTANCFALETGIPLEPCQAAEALIKSKPKRIHLGQAGERYFVLMASVGLDADVVYRVNPRVKKRLGRLAYVVKGFQCLASRRPKLQVRLDGEQPIEGFLAVVSNMRYYGGRFLVTPDAGFDKEELDVCIFQGEGAIAHLRFAWGVVRNRHLKFKNVIYRKAKEISIESPEPAHIQVDGDYFGTTPADFRIVPNALTVMLPGIQ
jgi:diacylglycerol kinase (ATP)